MKKSNNKLYQRLLALVLALTLCLGMMPMAAFAEGDDTPPTATETTTVNETTPEIIENEPEITENNMPETTEPEKQDPTGGEEPTVVTTDEEETGKDPVENKPEEPETPDYATQADLDAAFEQVGEVLESGDVQAGIDALDAYIAVYNRLSPEDQAANSEALAAAMAYQGTLRGSLVGEEDEDIKTLATDNVKVNLTVYIWDSFSGYGSKTPTKAGLKAKSSLSTSTVKLSNGYPPKTTQATWTGGADIFTASWTTDKGSASGTLTFLTPDELFSNIESCKYKYAKSYGSSYNGSSTIGNPYQLPAGAQGTSVYLMMYDVKVKPDTKTFTLNYNANGGINAPAKQTKTIADTSYDFTISSDEPTRSNYTFLGWSTNAKDTSPSYYGGGTINVTGTTTLYAVWKKNADKVTLTYMDRNGIYSGPTEYNKNATVTVIDCTNTRTDYEFKGWDTDSSADEVVYKVGDKFAINSSMTLYAVWQKKTTDNGNGISITKTRVSINNDTSKTTAEPGDVIKWSIEVTNNSNVTKTVTLTELANVSLSENSFTLKPAGQDGSSKTVTATYVVTGNEQLDSEGKFTNTVKGSTNNPDDGEEEDSDDGTKITASYTVNWVDTDEEPIKAPETRKGTVGTTVSATTGDKTVNGYRYLGDTDSRCKPSDTLQASGTVLTLVFVKQLWVKWVDEDGDVLEGPKYFDKGTAEPTRTISNPTKAEDENYTYEFKEWVRTADGDGNVTYTATYTATPKAKTITPQAIHTYYDNLEEASKPNGTGTANGQITVTGDPVEAGEQAGADVKAKHASYDGKAYICVSEPSDFTVTKDSYTFNFRYVRAITVKWLKEDGTQIKQITIPNGSDSYKDEYPADQSTTGKWGEPDTDGDGNITIRWEEPNPGTTTPSLTVGKEIGLVKAPDGTIRYDKIPRPGDTIQYQIIVTNTGITDVTGVVITDVLDGNLEFVNAVGTGKSWASAPIGGRYDFNKKLIGGDEQNNKITLTITVKVKDDVKPGTEIKNTATADCDDMPDGEEPSSSADVTVEETRPEEPKTYTVTYTWDGLPDGTTDPAEPETRSYAKGDSVIVDTEFVKGTEREVGGKTYVFSGWDRNDFTMPAEDVTIRGTWAEKTYAVTYKWTGLPIEGDGLPTLPAKQSYKAGDSVAVDGREAGSTVTINGTIYTFSGWDRGDFTMPAENVTINGTWSASSQPDQTPTPTQGPTSTPTPTPTPSNSPEPTDEPTDIPDPEPPLTESPDVTPTPSTPPVTPDPEPSEPPVEIPDEDPPLAEIPDEDPPLAEYPDEDDDLTEIEDEVVPLADVPKTGDDAKIWLTLALLSAAGLGVIGLMQRRTRKNGRDS